MYFEGWYLYREIEKEGSGKTHMVLGTGFQIVAIILVIYTYYRFGVAMYDAGAALVSV
jgi:type IV secretory pathway TrbD component